jgi:hypothetical protein
MKRLLFPFVLSLNIGGCALHTVDKATNPIPLSTAQDRELPLFSDNSAGTMPYGWAPLVILRTKKRTQYELVTDGGKTVLHAHAMASSSAMMHKLSVDPAERPWITWQWKVAELLKSADNTQRATEDSPVRIILGFDGDKEALPFTDQILFETAKLVTGHDFPYATLMYIWENHLPVGTVIRSTHSARIKMMVAASGPQGIGQWQQFSRNIVDDYEKAFGEKPGRLIGVGVLTDTDNTGETVDAWYGDIRLRAGR